MKIKIIPETPEEIENCEKAEYTNVEDYCIFGKKINLETQEKEDFHNWRGNIRFLMSNLQYYYELLNDERREKESKPKTPMIKKFDSSQLRIIDTENIPTNDNPEDIDDVLPTPGFELK